MITTQPISNSESDYECGHIRSIFRACSRSFLHLSRQHCRAPSRVTRGAPGGSGSWTNGEGAFVISATAPFQNAVGLGGELTPAFGAAVLAPAIVDCATPIVLLHISACFVQITIHRAKEATGAVQRVAARTENACRERLAFAAAHHVHVPGHGRQGMAGDHIANEAGIECAGPRFERLLFEVIGMDAGFLNEL